MEKTKTLQNFLDENYNSDEEKQAIINYLVEQQVITDTNGAITDELEQKVRHAKWVAVDDCWLGGLD